MDNFKVGDEVWLKGTVEDIVPRNSTKPEIKVLDNMITDKPLQVEQEQFKVGDDVWIKGKIIDIIDKGDGAYEVECIDFEDDNVCADFRPDQLHKSIPNLNKDTNPIKQLGEPVEPIVPRNSTKPEIKVLDNSIFDDIEFGKVDIKIETAINRSLSATQKALESVQPQKASIMFGDSDLNHEDIDDDDLIRGRVK